MKERTLQILRYLAVPCIFGSLALSADDYSDSSSASASSDKSHFVSTYDRLKGKELTPEAGPVVSGGVDVYIDVDYIYWHASEGGLAYVQQGGDTPITAPATSNNVLGQGPTLSPHFKMSSGFKVGLGLDFSYDGWDMGLMYTWLRPNASSSFAAAGVGAQNVALWRTSPVVLAVGVNSDQVSSTGTPTSGSASWKLHFNVLDLELGRACFVSPKLVVRPHFGLKGTWDTQTYTVQYRATGSSVVTISSGGVNSTVASTDVETYTMSQKQNYWGLGARTGVNSSWMVSKNFSFFGNWALAALWGQFKDTRSDVSNLATSNGVTRLQNYNTINARSRTHQLSPVFELELGLRYDYWFCDDEYRFRLGASWENQMWLNQNHFITRRSNEVLGDLSLQGFTLNMRFDF